MRTHVRPGPHLGRSVIALTVTFGHRYNWR